MKADLIEPITSKVSTDDHRFAAKLDEHGLRLERGRLETLQINVGRKCNQACRHCHVAAAPWRKEMMREPVARRVADWIEQYRPGIVDLTGGAPELSEFWRFFVETSRAAGARVLDRCNLTILLEPGFEWLADYLAEHEVEVIASLPCYLEENVNRQRGRGVFEKSLRALQELNQRGYGTLHPLHLVYNPQGASLPGSQPELESDYKAELSRRYGITFNRLFTVTNQPIARFAEDLRRQGQWDSYLDLLANSFNPGTVEGLMCRTTLSIGYEGEVYDCDFNQMLGMQLRNGKPLYLWDLTVDRLEAQPIQTGAHCLACTAGCGSSCGGALTGGSPEG